ncbi:endonuclease [Dyadobacter luteus]|uniref:Endonuclease n=2 Tax=Dyadobacter luteus TaxID=2259619 RepID=A0A3D8YE48_9BACT|nr:endonuclease [Dyadobacter luteus]
MGSKPDQMSLKLTVRNRAVLQVAMAFVFLIIPLTGWEVVSARENIPVHSSTNGLQGCDTLRCGSFSVLTYNIAGLPEIISSAKTKRASSIARIGRLINQFDVVNVQEDFNYNKYLYHSGNSHSFRTKTKGKVPFGDGLNTLSHYPVHQTVRIPWSHCTGADCLTPKGFTYSRLQIAKDQFIDLYNVHTNAYNHPSAAAARRENIRQLSAFIEKKSANQAVIIMGDLNAHYDFHLDNLPELLSKNNLKDAWLELGRQKLPVVTTRLPDDRILQVNNQTESIDKILYRSNDQVKLLVSDYQVQHQLFKNESDIPLSDHHPVGIVFSWQLLGSSAYENGLTALK